MTRTRTATRKPAPTHSLRRGLETLEDRALPSGTPDLFAIGGPGRDYPMQEAVDVVGNVYVGGAFNGTVDLDPGPGTFNQVETTGQISGYLAANAGDTGGARYSRKLLRDVSRNEAPLRITELPKWVREHREVSKREWASKEVGSKANCVACHVDAEKGYFDDD